MLNSFKTFNVFLQMWGPGLHTVLYMWSNVSLVKHFKVFLVDQWRPTLYFITRLLLRVRFDSLQTTTTNHLYICRRFNSRYFVRCTSSIYFKLSTLLQAVRLRRYAGRCSLRLWIFATIDIRLLHCSQAAPQIFAAPVYRANCAVIFATAQLSCNYQVNT